MPEFIMERDAMTGDVTFSGKVSGDELRRIRLDEDPEVRGAGQTLLEAAMRAYVSSKLGETVELP
jgi:hypothetical protein